MNKRVLKLLSWFITCSLFVASMPQSILYASDVSGCQETYVNEQVAEDITELIPEQATLYVESELDSIMLMVRHWAEALNIDKDKLGEVYVGDPYFICDLDTSESNEIYFYPIINSGNDQIVCVVSLLGTVDGWTYSVDTEMVELLEDVDYTENQTIFYESDDCIFADNYESVESLDHIGNAECENFSEKTFDEKVDVIHEKMLNVQKVDTDVQVESNLEAYTPGYTKNAKANVLTLYNPQSQGTLPICWAASVATIVNYIKGKKISAKAVCRREKTGYVGANIDTKQKALKDYGVRYSKNRDYQIGWTTIKSNIDAKKPIAVSSFTSDGKRAHAVTAYAYVTAGTTKYVAIWNSGSNSVQTFKYQKSGSCYSYNNATFFWKATLSAK